MIIDLITNSQEIVNYVKKSEGCGDIEDKQPKAYVMLNVQIGFFDDLYKRLEKLIEEEKINKNKYGYRVLDPRGVVRIEEGNLS
ncbi:MAG: hypothetical protein PHH54_00485 [Candidatus Nanoarchaeia archaeon]|nr:hypothetical protein [Candidatus Nanoarchaeia archaeon]MDD5740440.1 hypothetical protein [Candidatus Nanoarchaeia archaeon]